MPPGDQTISAGGAGAAINGSQATGVFGLSVKLKINFISERTQGQGREEGAEWRETARNIPGSLCPSLPSEPLEPLTQAGTIVSPHIKYSLQLV